MVKTYSRRLLTPYTGQVQIAETGEARALSLDGRHWEIQYQVVGGQAPPGVRNEGDKQVYQYARIGAVKSSEIVRYPVHPMLDADKVTTAIDRLSARVIHSTVPFESLDRYEYWLLDEVDQQPLALVTACTDADEAESSRARPIWIAMPAAQLDISDPAANGDQYVAPVNYRLQKLIEQRAGSHPRGEWFQRDKNETAAFPPLLIAENWADEEQQRLCQRYIERLAPRLLMLQGMPHEDRQRLERAAKHHALEVDQFCDLYPEVVDQKLMNALRVEAKMRRAAVPAS